MTQFFYNLTVFFTYLVPGNYVWVAIVVITVLLRLIFLKSSITMAKMQVKQKGMQEKINGIKDKHKEDKQAQQQAMMQLYKDEKFNPLASCLPTIIQMVVLIGFYGVFTRVGLGPIHEDMMYSFVPRPESLNATFFGLDLTKSVRELFGQGGIQQLSLLLPIVAGGLQLILSLQMRALHPKPKKGGEPDFSSMLTGQFTFIFPIMTAYISYTLVSALSIYWIVQTLFMVVQQKYINDNVIKKDMGKTGDGEVREIESSKSPEKEKTFSKRGVEVTVREKR